MISDRALDAAVANGVLVPDQVVRLRAIEAGLSPDVARDPIDDESLRFVTGFADIFVTIGIMLFLGALAVLMDSGTGSTPMLAGIAACAWLLAEFFTGKRRMALPSIVLLVAFAGSIFVLVLQVAAALLPPGWQLSGATVETAIGAFRSGSSVVVAALLTVGLCAMHYARFRVPITVAAGAAALCLLFVTIVLFALPQARLSETALDVACLCCGLAVFALAMRFDMSDPLRLTRRSDIAFWLHLLAAPLIVHPLLRGFLHGLDSRLTPGAAFGVLWVFVALGLLAVVVDRRAILVAGLVYAGFALSSLVRSAGLGSSAPVMPGVALALGAFILLLSAGWQPLRRAILRRLPRPLAARLPHPLAISRS